MNEAVLYELQNMSEATGSSCGTCAKLEVLSAQIVKAAPRVRPYPTSNNGACFKTKLRKVIYKKSAPLPFAAIRGITPTRQMLSELWKQNRVKVMLDLQLVLGE